MGRKMKRISVKDRLKDVSVYDFDCPLKDLIAWAQSEIDDHGDYSELFLSVEPYGYDGGVEFALYGERLESDSEYEKRCEAVRKDREKEKAKREAKKEAEYEEYLRLKEKFED